MEEIENVQNRDTFLYPVIASIESQKQKLKCRLKRQAQFACIEPKCEVSGLMCTDSKCQCWANHFKCHHIFLDRLLKSIQSHQKQLPPNVKQSYKEIYSNINAMIQQLSQLRNKLQKQENYFGLRNQELNFVQLINQDKIQEISGKYISTLEPTFQAQISFEIDTKQKIVEDFKKNRAQFDIICKFIENKYSKNKFKKEKYIDSMIVTEQSDKQLIHQWVSKNSNNPEKQISYNLLFRASQHQYRASQFHRLCDGTLNTLVIVKSQFDKVFGGFTQKAWFSPLTRTSINDDQKKAYMFSLNMKQKYQCTKPSQSIKCDKDYGPIFGGGCDLYLRDKCNIESNSGVNPFYSYNLKIQGKNKYASCEPGSNNLLAGCTSGNNFKVQDYEVYQIRGL